MRDPVNPPAVIRETQDHNQALVAAKGLAERVVVDLIELGQWLDRARKLCPHGDWESSLKRHGFNPSSARRWMQRAKESAGKTLTVSVLDAITAPLPNDDTTTLFAEKSPPRPTPSFHPSPETPKNVHTSSNAKNTPDEEADDPLTCSRCKRAKRVGQPVPANCADCRGLRVQARQNTPAPWEDEDAPKVPEATRDDPVQSEGDDDVRPVDAAGVVIPDRVRGVIACTAIADDCQTLMDFSDSLDDLCKAPGGKRVAEVLDDVRARLLWCRDALMAKRLPFVCPDPSCRGLSQSCALCDGVGAVTQELYA